MSTIKAALKAAKSALDGQNYEEAAVQANTVLNSEPGNYFAYVLIVLSHGLDLFFFSSFSSSFFFFKKKLLQLIAHRQVFLGRALEKQGKVHPAINAYKAATKIKPEDELAWKGLWNAYAGLGSGGVDGHTEAGMGLAQIHAEK